MILIKIKGGNLVKCKQGKIKAYENQGPLTLVLLTSFFLIQGQITLNILVWSSHNRTHPRPCGYISILCDSLIKIASDIPLLEFKQQNC